LHGFKIFAKLLRTHTKSYFYKRLDW